MKITLNNNRVIEARFIKASNGIITIFETMDGREITIKNDNIKNINN